MEIKLETCRQVMGSSTWEICRLVTENSKQEIYKLVMVSSRQGTCKLVMESTLACGRLEMEKNMGTSCR